MDEKLIRIPYDDKPSFKKRILQQAVKEEHNMNKMIHVAIKFYLDTQDRLANPKIYK